MWRYIGVVIFSALHWVFAQEVQWADYVIDYSSEMGDKGFSASQALGKPNSMPQPDGLSPCAWLPRNQDGEKEYIHVGFKKPMRVRQVAIAENHAPGAVYRVLLYDTAGNAHEIYKQKPQPYPAPNRMLNIFLSELTPYYVKSVQVFLNCKAVKGWNQIDAIAISDGTDTIKATINYLPGTAKVEKPVRLSENVNSPYEELFPVISFDESVLYFTRNGHPENIGEKKAQDIWYAVRRPDGDFEPARNLGPPVNNEGHNYLCSVTPDGNTILLGNVYLPNGELRKGLSISHREKEGWRFPEPLRIANFYNKNKYAEYFLASSGNVLLLCIEREDSYGSKDIYVSFLKEDGTWTEPLNLGPTINTPHREASPFLAADGITLYYSSMGFSGFGKGDMFMSRRLDSSWTKWSEPINLGPVLNTSEWDGYYTIPASGEVAYFVSHQDSTAKSDIYRVTLPPELRPYPVCIVKGFVFDVHSNQPMGVQISYESLTSGKRLGIAHSHPVTGAYQIILPPGDLYGFLAVKDGFVSVSEHIDLRKLEKFSVIEKNLYIVPVEHAKRIRLNNIFFESGSANLQIESTSELDRLVALLAKYKEYAIVLEGHTDDVGEDEYNLRLSEERAKAVRDYLVKKGIDPKRIRYVGYGESRPAKPNTSPENRQYNRRVEYTIIVREQDNVEIIQSE